jgi:hypothetical protein
MTSSEEIPVLAPFRLPTALELPNVSMRRRVQYVAMLQLAQSGRAYWATTAAICRGTDRRDLEAALVILHNDGLVDGDTCRLDSMVSLAEAGLLELTARGQLQLSTDSV